MRSLALLLASTFAAPIAAQTTGVFGINDFVINGSVPGSTSCTPLCFPNGNLTLNLDVFGPTGAFAVVLFNFCPCLPCSLPGPTNSCAPPIPLSACGPSNQSLDIDLSAACGIAFTVLAAPNTAGFTSGQLVIPPIPGLPCGSLVASAQAVVIDPCGLGLFGVTGPFVVTQAYTLLF